MAWVLPHFRASQAGGFTYNFVVQEVSRRKALWLEVGALSAWIFLPDVVSTFSRDPAVGPQLPGGEWGSFGYLLGSVGGLCLLGLVLWMSGDPLSKFGLRKFKVHPDLWVVLGLVGLLVITQYLPYRSFMQSFDFSEFRRRGLAEIGFLRGALMILSWTASSVFSELFYRGFLITRLEELTKNVWIGVVAVAFIEALGSIVGGFQFFLITLGFSLPMGIAFVVRRSIWPLVIASVTMRILYAFLT